MSGVTSVRSYRDDPSRKGPIIIGIIAALVLIGGLSSGEAGGIIFGLLLVAGAAAWWFYQKPDFSVMLSSASGEVKALKSKDSIFISNVINALNDAIVHRG